jgi:zinc/manganese transport system substrate-binding protein
LAAPLAAPLAALLLAAAVLSGCGTGTESADDGRPVVVATTSILGDITANVTGGLARVEVLMPRGTDPHDFEPSARQAELLRSADLVVANGLGLEEGLSGALASAAADGVTVLEVAPQLDPITADDEAFDPHVWMDVNRVVRMTGLIADALAASTDIDPDALNDAAEEYQAELVALDAEISGRLASVPAERRLLVTNHDAFGYFAASQGFEVVGTVLPAGSSLAEPSPSDLAALARQIDELGVPAIFTETTTSTDLARTLAAEAGGVPVVGLYADSLGPEGSDGDTYVAMMRTNAVRMAEALG